MKNYPLYEHPDLTNLKQLITMQADHIPNQTAFEYLKKGDIRVRFIVRNCGNLKVNGRRNGRTNNRR